jgi:hypothetical protein
MKDGNKKKDKTKSNEPFSSETPNPPQVINPSEQPPKNFSISQDKKDAAKPVKK